MKPFISQKFSLKGKTAMIAGGGGILGPWFVAALAESGADIIVVYMDDVRA